MKGLNGSTASHSDFTRRQRGYLNVALPGSAKLVRLKAIDLREHWPINSPDHTHRVEHRHRITTREAAYRGLDGASPLFLTDEGEPYKLTERRTTTGAISYSCDSLSQLFRKLHLQAGVEGASAMSGRRTFAVNLNNKGYDLKHVKVLLGLRTLQATKALIDADPVRLGRIAAGVF